MATFPGAYLTVLYAILLHFTLVGIDSVLINSANNLVSHGFFSIQGVILICYPVIGLLGDIKFTRYKMISYSFWLIFIPHCLMIVLSIIILSNYSSCSHLNEQYVLGKFHTAFTAIFVIIAMCGKGMFESTALQFGFDQMIEASSSQLSSFIHWYYWGLHLGSIVIHVIMGIIGYCFINCLIEIDCINIGINTAARAVLLSMSVIQFISCLIMFMFLYLKKFKNYLKIESTRNNPLKEIVDVLKYGCKHKYPVRRSALTFYHNSYPARLDHGKVQYGGPFTNEQVENTKTIFRLSALLLSLVGFNLSGNYSVTGHILQKTCVSSSVLDYLLSNPSFLSDVTPVLVIPLCHFLKKCSLSRYFPNMLRRMWLGLLLLFLQELVSLIISTQIEYSNCEALDNLLPMHSSIEICYASVTQFKNGSVWSNVTECGKICSPSLFTMDSKLVWLLIPQVLYGFGYMLVFMTALEFICAQAPYTSKGFMVGIWYSMLSVKYLLVGNIDTVMRQENERNWIIYESIKVGLIGLSLIVFGAVCRWYRYHERDEVVNIQEMIENIYEKELMQKYSTDTRDDESISITSDPTTYYTID
jgi:peptide/histidine transporter 3/4